jgi:hypothetical protein
MLMTLEPDGLHQLYPEQMVDFHQYYPDLVQSHITLVQNRQYGLLSVM